MKAVNYEVSSEKVLLKESTNRIIFDKNVLNKMRPAINKRKTARQNKLRNQKKYDQNFDNNTSVLEDLYSYCDQLDLFQGTNSNLTNYDYNEQIGNEIGVKLSDSKIESFGLAAKITTPKAPEKAFGMAARLRGNSLNEKFEREFVEETFSGISSHSKNGNLSKFSINNNQNTLLSPPKRIPRIDDLNDQPYEDNGLELDAGSSSLAGQCFLQITTKSKSSAKEKRANKRKNKKKNSEKMR